MPENLTLKGEAQKVEDRAFAELHQLVLEEARRIAHARHSTQIAREDVEEALRRALRLFLERNLELARKARQERAVRLVESWLNDKSGYDERVWPQLSRDIEENRLTLRSRLGG
jgi:hypothetical protein